jgi:hypothetical protein
MAFLEVRWSPDLVTATMATLNRHQHTGYTSVPMIVQGVTATGLRTDIEQIEGLLADLKRDSYVRSKPVWGYPDVWALTVKGRESVADELIAARKRVAELELAAEAR